MFKKKNSLIIVSILTIILMLAVGSYAFWTWKSEEDKNIVFNTSKQLQDYIIYDEGESKFVGDFKISSTYLDGVHTTVSIYKTEEAKDIEMYATINMRINEIKENLKNFSGLKWTLTEGNATSNGSILASGNFIDYNINDTIELKTNIEVLTELKEYTVWIWLDSAENPDASLTGEKVDTSIWTQVNQLRDETFEITSVSSDNDTIKAKVVNKGAKITHYQITTENIEPIGWIEIASDKIGNTYTLEYLGASIGTNYVWVKDETGKVISKSVIVSSIYQITYNLNGGTHGDNPPTEYESGIETTLVAPTKEEYSFDGWYLSEDFSGTAISEIPSTQIGDIVLYAKWIDDTAPIITYISSGGLKYNDPTFASGINGTAIYNNLGNGNVSVTRTAMTTPVGSYGLEIKTVGTASPGHGGFYFATPTQANEILITKIIAKIPVGYNIAFGTNAIGETAGDAKAIWLTTTEGTGNWKEYIFYVKAGSSGTFLTTNFYYITGGSTATASNPVTWHVAYATVYTSVDYSKIQAGISFYVNDTGSGIAAYGINQSNTTEPTWITGDFGKAIGQVYENITSNGTYYIWVKDKENNISKQSVIVNKIDTEGPYGRVNLSLNKGTYTVSLADSGDDVSGINTTYGFALISSGSCASASYTNQTGTSKTYSGSYMAGTTYYGCIKLTDNAGNVSYINSSGITYSTYNTTYSDIANSYRCNNASAGSSPYIFTYTGNCQVVSSSSCATVSNDSNSYCIKFLTSGTFNTTENTTVDIFLVGGGAGGNGGYGNGGGGGYTKTQKNINLAANTNYSVTIGAGGASKANGGTSVFGSYSAAGGNTSGSGGSGGGNNSYWADSNISTAGSDGSNGGGGLSGQGTTTREFGVSNATLYAGGGAGYCSNNAGTYYVALNGGAGGGGNNGLAYNKSGGNGTANTGGGGGGGHAGAGSGGSGIVIIRNTYIINNSAPVSTINLIYDNNGGSGCHSKSITNGLTYGELCTPTRKEYIFNGWYTAATGGTQITASTTVSTTSNQTLYAHWISTIYPNISFGTNGNSSYVSGDISSTINVSRGKSDLDISTYKYIWSTNKNVTPNTSFTSGSSYTLSNSTGIYYLIAKACDINGNCATDTSGAFYVDNSYPTGSISSTAGSNMINATLNVSDTGSGVKSTYGWKISTSNVCNASTTGFTNSPNKTYSFSISASGTYYVCAKVTDNVGHDSYIVSSGISATYTNPLNGFGYTGTYSIIENSNGVMTIKLTSSGTLTLSANAQVDVALVGGGAGGSRGGKGGDGDPCYGGAGGGGGAVVTYSKISLSKGTNYLISIGAGGASDNAGGDTTGFGLTAKGGSVDGGGRGAYLNGYVQGDSYGSLGGSNGTNVWNLGTYYGASGGGASCYNSKFVYSSAHLGDVHDGGTTGGGTGGSEGSAGSAATANTGSGGGGGGVKAWGYCDKYYTCGTSYSGGSGGSGAVIIRNSR